VELRGYGSVMARLAATLDRSWLYERADRCHCKRKPVARAGRPT
jgi:hypothetical protein